MENFRKKLKNQGAFTLVEMLIVVAIIAILIAVSIPVMNTALEKTRVATDAANERAAKAAATVGYLSETLFDMEVDAAYDGGDYFYDAAAGKLVEGKDGISPYGKCTKDDGHKDMVIKVRVEKNGDVTIKWTKDGNSLVDTHGIDIKAQKP